MRLGHGKRDPKMERLAAVPLFAKASDEALEHLVSAVDEVEVDAGYTLITQGTRHGEAYVIQHGAVEVFVDDESVATLGDGEMIGEVGLLAPGVASATIRTTAPTSLLVLPHNRFDQLLDDLPELAKLLAVALAERLRSMDAHHHSH